MILPLLPRLSLCAALVVALAGVAVPTARAEDAVRPGPAPAAEPMPKAVVELFTSQGCASCPPADALLGELARDPGIIPLTLAVDYWDYIGWKDTLAQHGHSQRQRAYADVRGDRKIYTPQMVVDGIQAAIGSDRPAVEKALVSAKAGGSAMTVPVSLAREGDDLVVDVRALPRAPGAEVWACPVIRSHTVAIGRGENGGRNVTYTNVVRGWVRVGTWDGDAERFKVPVNQLRLEGVNAVVVLLQSGTFAAPGPILGAATLPLN
ncbi:DUF1223 domain-containing protein [Azorhizobium doebereinerae]|uniref:DUF1223 domain-containing protein n=1 Tax=Azorhizobium doebereinerae TaxID=281091 RepID=UPI000407FEC8|nr:DUF1223 domain-containing protein [Azorhizobium doebereinerae]